eukprot:1999329-Ditylum_brightwellii.AAC.2
MTNLFKAHLVASDGNFVRYIVTKKDAYDNGTDISVNTLMAHTKTKYESQRVKTGNNFKKQDKFKGKDKEKFKKKDVKKTKRDP